MFKTFGIGVLACLLVACGAPQPRRTAPQNPPTAVPGLEVPPAGTRYTIDASRSELRILVYRAGPLARFGHNHVMQNRAIRGTASRAERGATFSLDVPVAEFTVDDPGARREEGADFAGEIPEDAKSGTLHNMLSSPVLDAEQFPVITVTGVAAAGASGSAQWVASIAIRVAGHESKIEVPFTLATLPHGWTATGSLDLRQSALGLTPYSLMLGALQVQDEMMIKFRLVAAGS